MTRMLESADQQLDCVLAADAPLSTEWPADLWGGVRVIRGQFAHGDPMLAVPNSARLKRGDRPLVWIRTQ
jgi:hypothetical protein